MASRYGDANENGNQEACMSNSKRRSTRHYDPTITHHAVSFKAFTRDSLANSQRRRSSKAKKNSATCFDPTRPKSEPDPYLASGQQLPAALARQMPGELIGKPIEDIDPFYEDQETFVIVSRGKELTRFSAKKALYLLGPFHPIRRIVLFILVSPIFNLLVILTILINCILMTIQGSETVERTEIIFTIVYTTEMGLKVLARGFIIDQFTYLRDPWNWLDFAVIIMAYLTIVIQDLGNLSVMRTFRVLRALKTVAIIPGMKTIVGAVIDSVKNLKDVVVLTLFSLSVFSLLGLQIYMGILTQKCILNGPTNMTDSEWFAWNNSSSHWIPEADDEIWGAYRLCGNATGAQSCPPDHTCLQGFGPNPDYGFTNFDTFGWALICSFRLMTQDFWEGLYMQVLKTAGSWHIIFFLVSIFLGSIYLMNLILAIVAMSYNELQRRAEEEEEAAAQDEAAFLESCRLMELHEQMSQLSHSTPDPGTSYRPSVEIGLVGQTLLSSLCQNGLLGQHVRDKLNQQLILPSLGPAGARSHSLSVNLERRTSHVNSQWMAGPSAHHHHNPQYDPLTMATSMTELRRKSSVRTNDSDSPKSRIVSTTGSAGNSKAKHLGQRRILPDVGVRGRLKDGRRMSNRMFPHHASSGYLMLKRKDSDNASETSLGPGSFVRRFPARPSATSDRDLQVLRQRAAMIRIGSANTLSSDEQNMDRLNVSQQYTINEEQTSKLQVNDSPRSTDKFRRRSDLGAKSSSFDHRNGSFNLPFDSNETVPEGAFTFSHQMRARGSSDRSSICDTNNTITSRSTNNQLDSAICEQPTSLHPFGRSNLSNQNRRCSTLSNVERPTSITTGRRVDKTSSQQHLSAGESITGRNGLLAIDRKVIGGSMSAQQSIKNSSTTTNASSFSRSPKQLGVESCLRPDNMHHLSVENFQQFSNSPRHGTSNQLHVHETSRPLNTNLNISDLSRHSSIQQDPEGSIDLYARLRQRSINYDSGKQNIHPSTMVRSSFSRPRQSFLVGRRISKDFARRASDWSRLSMSTNVDLRRLLKLWANTNPYQGRPSVGSCSNYSQSGNRFDPDSPAQSIKGENQYGACNSSRPSSVSSAWQAYEIISAMSRRNQRLRSDARGPYATLPLDDNMIDRMSINMRDKCVAYCLSCLDIICIWECCGIWLKIQKVIALVVFDPFTELFIILCILINTLFMALDSDDADDYMRSIFERGNYFFTATFAVEASMKIMALSPKFYFREGWNVFDSIIVGLSLLELGLEGVYGLSVLRSFRLLRVFKLAKSWPTLNLLISIMGKAVGDLGNLTFVLAIIVFIFAVMGMQLFGSKYQASNFPSGELPRWNFTDFMHSFMIVFRILCAEWIEPMWDCLLVGGWPCIPFFLIAVTVGNLVVLNLFLALLLASFGASNLSSPQADNVDTRKLQEAIARFGRFGRWAKKTFFRSLFCIAVWLHVIEKPQNSTSTGAKKFPQHFKRTQKSSHIARLSRGERAKNIEKRTQELKIKCRRSPERHYHLKRLAQLQRKGIQSPSPEGYNFDYDQRLAPHANSTGPMPMIPIIVNEACELPDEQSETDRQSIGHSNAANNQSSEHKSPPSMGDVEFNDSMSFCSDVSLHGSDFRGEVDSRFTPSRASSSTTPVYGNLNKQSSVSTLGCSNRPVAGYSNNMQPIKEDSKDDSTSSLSQVNTTSGAGADQSQSSTAFRGSSYDHLVSKLNDQTSTTDRTILRGDEIQHESTVQLREPLLHNSKRDHFATIIDSSDSNRCKISKEETTDSLDENAEDRPKSSLYLKAPKKQEMEEDDERTLRHIETYIERCMWVGIICLRWFLFRQYIRKIVEHKYFDQCILVLIVISSGTLALEDKHLNERPTLKRTLDVLDTIFTVLFSLEMVFKWLAFGIRRYFGNIWSWLDFIIVLVSFINLMASIFGSGKIQALKTMRTLRAMRGLRPLRALQRFQGMRVVVNALIQAIPSIFNVLLVCLIFWLIFSIMGVQMFGGKFWRCIDPETDRIVPYDIASNRPECNERNLTWSNPQINFDNVLNAYLALFQVATFKGWIDIMNSATDSRNRDDQPIREANIYMYFYFVFFVIFGSFFTLNLFIGVIIDNFNEQKKKTGGSLEIFMTEDQKKYYHAMKKMRSKKPIKAMTRPKFKLQAYMFDITTSKRFDLAIMIIIGLNMFVMALEHYGQSQEFSSVLENLNLIFIAIFTLECLCKIFAMRHFYFREPWNVFDSIVVALSLLGVVMKEYVAKYFVSPTLLRVVRVVKVGRVLRLVKGAKGIRTLLFALAMSLPALFNICLLLFLVMFIYAIFGMSFFMNVRKRNGIDETFNFETFPSSIIILFQMSTSAGWDLVLDPLMDEENDCQKPDPINGIEGTCGNKGIAIAYLISYVIVTFLIIINMYIAVILENYSQATEDVQEGLTDDDYEMYYEIWQKFDPDGTQYLPYSMLSDFVDALEDPLRIPKPNDLALVVLDINIYQGDRCYCVDILDALTKYFFTRKGFVIQVNEHLQKVQSTLHETPFERVTTTYLLKREHYCARIIQNCWRRWKQQAQLARQDTLEGAKGDQGTHVVIDVQNGRSSSKSVLDSTTIAHESTAK